MPEIIPNQNFKHERDQYEAGKSYDVSPELAYYFKMCGWVGDPKPTGENTTLEIHDSHLGHSSEVK